jgi:gamma-glutamyltranspeptidase/glutathione hydrolase
MGLIGCTDQKEEKVAQEQEVAVEKVEDGVRLSDEEMDLSVRDAKGSNGVVAAANPYASKIGLDIMKNGGNAVDAAVAMAFTMGLVEPNASGPAGSGFMMIHDAKTGKQAFLDYLPTAPAALTQEIFESYDKPTQKKTGVAAGVPGAVDGWLTALENYGTMSAEQVLEPVIELAEKGYVISPHLVEVVQDSYELILSHEETAKVFLKEDLPYEAGEVFKNPDYAKVLRKIAKEGKDGFYKGEVAEAIVQAVKADGGLMTLEDLANYKAKFREPVGVDYRGYKVISAPPSSSGGIAVLEGLNIAQKFDVKAMGSNTPETLHLWSEIFKVVHADRYNYVADPDFSHIPVDVLTSEQYAKDRLKAIDMEKSAEEQKPGSPLEYESPSTTHISIMDKEGNMVSMTNSVGLYFGCGVVPKNTGFVLNTYVFNFSKDYEVNKAAPGKRARSTMSPTIILKDGKAFATLGTPGGGRIPGTVMQIISNIIDHGMGIQDAINQPRIHQLHKNALYVEGSIPENVRNELAKKGHEIELKGTNDAYFGGVQGIVRDLETNEMHGGADSRRDGKAFAY